MKKKSGVKNLRGGAVSGLVFGAEKFFVRPPFAPNACGVFRYPPIGTVTIIWRAPCYLYRETGSPVRVLLWAPPSLQPCSAQVRLAEGLRPGASLPLPPR